VASNLGIGNLILETDALNVQQALQSQLFDVRPEGGLIKYPVHLDLSAESAAIQQCFSLTINQRTVLSAIINQRNEHAEGA
jgi:hypothetical protein